MGKWAGFMLPPELYSQVKQKLFQDFRKSLIIRRKRKKKEQGEKEA